MKRATLVHAPWCIVTRGGACICHLALRHAEKTRAELDLSELLAVDEEPTPVVAVVLDASDLSQAPTRPAQFLGFADDDTDDEPIAVYEWPG